MKKTISITVSMSLLLFSFSNYALINAEESPLLDEPTANSNTNIKSLDNKDELSSIEEAEETVKNNEIFERKISESELAQLEDNNILIVTFDPTGGTMDKTVYEVDEGKYPWEAFSSYPEPKKEGFIFKGWYADEEYKVEISQSGRITENKTFYAYWEKQFDTSLISDDLVQYMLDAKGYEMPFSEEDLSFIYDFETPYIFEDRDTSKFEYREIRDYTGIEYFKNVNMLTVRINPEAPMSDAELQGLAKMTNIYDVVFEARMPENILNAEYFDQDWYISKTLSSKENVKIFEDEVIKVLLALSFNPALSGLDNQVQIHFDYSLKFLDMSFLTQLNQRSESFSFEMQSGEIGTTFFEKPEVEIVDDKVYYKIVFDNPFIVTYLNSQNKQVVDSESKYMKNSVYSSYDFGSYDDYPDAYYDELDKPLIVRYLNRDGNLIEGFSDDIDSPEFFTRYEILLSEAQMEDMIRRSSDPDYEMNTVNSPTKVLSGSMDYDIPDGAVDENGAIPVDNFNTYFSYQVLVDVGGLEMFHRVDFESNGGTPIDPIMNIENGALISNPGNPTKQGYKFMGWYLDNEEFMIDFDFGMPITRNLTLYAQWEATDEKYTVTYEENGGTEVADLTEVEAGTKLTEPTTTKSGYTFKGWYRDADFTTAWNFDIDLVESDITLYAKWEAIPVTYTVTYEENGGTEVANLTDVETGTKLTEPTTTKAGYTFKGWYRDAGFTTAWNFDIDVVESDVTLYAKWEAIPVTYTVTYEENGGTEVVDLTEVETGTKLTEPTTTKAGYTFKGWYRDAGFTKAWNFDIDLVESDITLYAKWEAIPVTYTVTYEENGGTEVADLTDVETGTKLTEPTTTKTGYTFKGWYRDAGFTTAWNFDIDLVESDVTLYAKWEAIPVTYMVTYEENGGTEVADLTDVETGTKLTEPTTTKVGYTFKGWYRDADFTTAWNFDIDLVESDVTLYAKWEAIPVTYTVTYEENGGTEVANLTEVETGTKLTEPTTTKAGYTFKGWYRDAGFTTAWNFDIDVVESDVTLYAKWEAIPVTYTVTYEENGGTAVVDLTDVEAGTKLTEPTTTKAGYAFKGWYRDAGFTTAWNFDIDLVESDVTLYAKWEAIPVTYTVTYEENGGTEVDDLLKVSAGTLLIEPITQREGFTFAGWYSDSTLLTQWNFAIDAVNSDITLFAKWNEKSIDPEVKPEPEVTEPETPKPEVKPEPVEKLPETGVAENLLPMAVAALGGMIVLLEMIKKKKDSYENKH